MAVGEPILKIVNSTMLDAGLTKIADAIRTKGGTSAQLAFPDGMADAIAAIEAGGGGINATAGTVTVAADCNDYPLTHGLGEIPEFFFIGTKDRVDSSSGKTHILIGAYGFTNYNAQYRISLTSASSSPSGVFRELAITHGNSGKISICGANENTITVAAGTGTMKLIAGATYYWVAIGSGVFT